MNSMKKLEYLKGLNDQEILDYNIKLYDNICENKREQNREISFNIKSKIIDRYKLYLSKTDELDSIEAVLEFQNYEKIMRDSYKSSNFEVARKRIFDCMPRGMKTTCPYCLISESDTLDHYFSEDEFAEYIIFTPNLIPCCTKCNRYKGKSRRNTLHLYFDTIPQLQYLIIELSFKDPFVPSVEISLNKSAPVLIQKHFKTLKLIDRYKNRCTDELASKSRSLLRSFQKNHYDSALEALEDEVESLENTYGKNYWKSCLYKSILKKNNDFKVFLTALSIEKL